MKLKLCPFCGKRGVLGGGEFPHVSCESVHCLGEAWGNTDSAAIAAWNRRPGEDAMYQTLKEIQDHNRGCEKIGADYNTGISILVDAALAKVEVEG